MAQGVFDPDADELNRDVRMLSCDLLEVDESLCSRVSPTDPVVLGELVRAFKRGLYVEPVVVARVGHGQGRRYVCMDGRARLEAARRSGVGQLLCEVFADSRAAAWAAIGENARPRQARRPADVRRAAKLAAWARPTGCPKVISEHINSERALVAEAMRGDA
jgi:hypothetical protein